MNDVQCMNHISKTDLENKGFSVEEINQNGYTEVSIGDVKGFVWFQPYEECSTGNTNYSIAFITEMSDKNFFKNLYENFEIFLLTEGDYTTYVMCNDQYVEEDQFKNLAEHSKKILLTEYPASVKMPKFACSENNSCDQPISKLFE